MFSQLDHTFAPWIRCRCEEDTELVVFIMTEVQLCVHSIDAVLGRYRVYSRFKN